MFNRQMCWSKPVNPVQSFVMMALAFCAFAFVSLPTYAQEQIAPTPTKATTLRKKKNAEPEACLKQPRLSKCNTVRIEAILVKGLSRTKRYVIERELLFEEGSYTSDTQIEESMTRLRNMGLFREVTYRLITKPVKEGESVDAKAGGIPRRVIELTFDERWTTLPAFKFGQGGGITQFIFGLYDINVLGRYWEIGGQYERLGYQETFFDSGGAANSFVVWFRNPRFLDSFWRVGADLWSVKRIRTVYDGQGDIEGGFLLERLQLVLRAEQEVAWWFRVGGSLELMNDDFSFDFIPDARRAAQLQSFGKLPDEGKAFILRFGAKFGRVNQDDYNYDGTLFSTYVGHTDKLWGADFRFTQLESSLRYYKKLPWRSNLALRAQVGLGNAKPIQHLFYIGGLDRVRGFVDSRFRGQNYWVANAEYRVAAFASRWFVLQPTAFVDFGSTANKTFDLLDVEAASAGVGLRIISPKIYRLVMRFDYAVPFINDGTAAFSFGAQQFF